MQRNAEVGLFTKPSSFVFHILYLLIVICNNLPAVQHPDKDTMIVVADNGKAVNIFNGKFL
jgi:hypothetical protein